jgi:exopolyphosphatase/guanosine-5'-triphosphate,3'-diphosphate pyrophosphatase
VSDWVAVVDLGSAATKLLLTDGTQRVRRTVDTRITTGGIDRIGPIGDDALHRLEDALIGFLPLITERDAAVRAVATEAVRGAANRDAVAAVVERRLGIGLETLDTETEARLGFRGVATDILGADHPAVITFDFGGGSTEVALAVGERLEGWLSLPIGGAVVTDTYLHGDPPRPEELSAALSVVELHVDDAVRLLPGMTHALVDGFVLGSGAVVTIAAVEAGLADVDPHNGSGDGPLHGFELTREAMEDVFRTLATEPAVDRAFNPGLPPGRVGDIVGACIVVVEVLRQLELPSITVSQRGLADGVAAEMLGRAPDDRDRAAASAAGGPAAGGGRAGQVSTAATDH